jgi:amino acid adenylation domain-containing protein
MKRDDISGNRNIVADHHHKERDYWLEALSGEIEKAVFPYDNKAVSKKVSGEDVWDMNRLEFRITGEMFERLMKLSNRYDPSLYMIMTAVVVLLLKKYGRLDDIIVGAPVFKQEKAARFINTVLAFRHTINDGMTFKELLLHVRQVQVEATENQNYPIETLLYKLELPDTAEGFPLFDVTVLLENIHDESYLKGVKTNIRYKFRRGEQEVRVIQESNAKRYKKTTAERILHHYGHLLEEALNGLDKPVGRLELQSDQERQNLMRMLNDTERPVERKNVFHQLFEEQAARTPGKIAARHNGREITYRQLNENANRLAHALREKGVVRDGRVALYMERSIEMLEGILATYKAGGAYVPIETTNPRERVNAVLVDSETEILLTTSRWIGEEENAEEFYRALAEKSRIVHVFVMDDMMDDLMTDMMSGMMSDMKYDTQDRSMWRQMPDQNPENRNSQEDLAYIIYTSGTTGKPKGVLIHHRGMINHQFAKINDLALTADDIVAQTASVGFDISVWQYLAILLIGGTVEVIDRDDQLEAERFLEKLRQEKVTVLESVPSLMTAFLEGVGNAEEANKALPHLRWMIPTGEALTVPLAREWFRHYPGIKLMNAYGPTEASDDVTHYILENSPLPEHENVPIGRPIQNTHIYILDDNHVQCPVGVRGEICVAGLGVGRGYWKDPGKTENAFIPNPYRREIADRMGEESTADFDVTDYDVLYKTGDIGYINEEGNIECLGRKDHQVKIRGNRIELGEIENRMKSHPGVVDAVVQVHQDQQGNKNLSAYIVSQTVQPPEIREYLLQRLPDYMVPLSIQVIDGIPVTASGKLDRKALPEPRFENQGPRYTAPRDLREKKLTEIWADVLQQEAQYIGIDANFFEQGGHSLRATILATRIHKEMNVRIHMTEIFSGPTIREQAAYIRKAEEEQYAAIPPQEKKEYYRLSPVQKRMYLVQQLDPESTGYNISQMLRLKGTIRPQQIEEIFRRLIRRHESFRTAIVEIDGEPVQRIYDDVAFSVQVMEDGTVPDPKRFIRPFSQDRAPLMRVGLIMEREDQYVMMVDMHHIISDGVSSDIINRDFAVMLRGEELPPITVQYKDYAEWEYTALRQAQVEKQQQYWQKEFSDGVPVLILPTDNPRPEIQRFEGAMTTFEIPAEQVTALRQYAQEREMTIFQVMLAAYNIMLVKVSGQEDIVVGIPVAGRKHTDQENIVGMFVNTLPIRTGPEKKKHVDQFMEEVKIKTLRAYENQDVALDDLADRVLKDRDPARNPMFDVMFLLQNFERTPQYVPGLEITTIPYDIPTTKFDLNLQGEEIGDTVSFLLQYSTHLFKPETIEVLVDYYKHVLASMAASVQEPPEPGKTLMEIMKHRLDKNEEHESHFNEDLEDE